MNYLEYRERITHGTFDFPFGFYAVGPNHPRYNMVYHWHAEYELLRVVAGRLHLTVDGAKYTLCPGELMVITGGSLHSGSPDVCEYECIVFDMDVVAGSGSVRHPEVASILGRQRQIVQRVPQGALAAMACAERMFSEMATHRDGHQLAVVGALYSFLGEVVRGGLYQQQDTVSAGGRWRLGQLKAVLGHIQVNYHENLTLADLAACAGMNSNYFCRFFRDMTGKTPIEYLNYYRVECACERLAASSDSITEVAMACGFNDLSYFIKVFKKFKGVTPSGYLQRACG